MKVELPAPVVSLKTKLMTLDMKWDEDAKIGVRITPPRPKKRPAYR
jgi:hypothetical protein